MPTHDIIDKERAGLAEAAQRLHGARRKRVEKFLRDLGTSPAESSSRNPLEQPWTLTPADFARRKEILRFAQNDKRGRGNDSRRMDAAQKLFTAVRDETAALTEEIAKVEKEIDARVTALYGL
jgi:hypothetical protein